MSETCASPAIARGQCEAGVCDEKRALEVLVMGHNHFDTMWRRCFLADAVYNGVTVKPYADIEELVLSAWLALASRGYTFTEGQAVILREWLRRDPTRLDRLKAEIACGRFSVVQAGETVQDSNLPTAEGLVRNFLVAQPLWRELGVENDPGLEIAWLEDAFGNSANYPQVLRGVGCRVAAKLSYRACPDEAWMGIDGTAMPVLDHVPQRNHGSWGKYPPCPACSGRGVPSATGRVCGLFRSSIVRVARGRCARRWGEPFRRTGFSWAGTRR